MRDALEDRQGDQTAPKREAAQFFEEVAGNSS